MRKFMTIVSQCSLWTCTAALLAGGIGLYLPSTSSAQELMISEDNFGCILDLPKVRNTRFKHADPEKLKEAMRIFRDSVPDKEYPVGTILQLVPFVRRGTAVPLSPSNDKIAELQKSDLRCTKK